MSFKSEMEAGLLEMEGDLAEDGVSPAFMWYGASIPCVPTSLQRSVEIAPDGNQVLVDAKLYVRAIHFTSADSDQVTVDDDSHTVDDFCLFPKTGHKLTFRGQTYRVAWAKLSGARSHVELNLESTSF